VECIGVSTPDIVQAVLQEVFTANHY